MPPQDESLLGLIETDERARRRLQRRETGLALDGAREVSPDQYVRNERAARILGVPPSVVQDDPDVPRQAQSIYDLMLLDDAPATARWIAQPGNAAVAHDQVENLTLLERMAYTLAAGRGYAGRRAFEESGIAVGIGDLGRRFAGGAIGAVGMGLEGLSALQRMNPGINPVQQAGGRYLADRVRLGGRAIEGNLTPQEQEQIRQLGLRSRVRGAATDTGFAGDVASGVGQMGGQLALIAASGGVAAPSLFLQGAGQMSERVDADMAEDGRTQYSAGDVAAILGGGAVTGLAEKFGLDAVLGRLPPVIQDRIKGKVASILFAGAAEGTSEVVEGIGQNALGMSLLDDGGGLLDGTVEGGSVGAAVGSLVRALVVTAIPGRQYLEGQENARRSRENLKRFDEIGENVANSELFKRSPERMESFLRAANPEAMVFLPAETVAMYFQSNPDLDAWVDEWDIRDQLEQADASGADIAIPASVYLTRVRPTAAHEAFKADLRIGFDSQSEKEAADELANGEKRAEAAMTDAEKIADDAETRGAPAERVRADIFSQLRASGRSIEVANREALVEMQRAQARAARSPDKYADAWEAYQAQPLTVQRVQSAARVRANMGRADTFIAALKAGKRRVSQRALAGQSLGEFISANGGVLDTGGDLASIGAGDWHKGKPGKRKLIRERGEGDNSAYETDSVLTRAIESGFLPEDATVEDLIAAIQAELSGRPTYSMDADRDLTTEENQAQLDEFEAMLAELGLNAKTDTAETIKAALEAASREPDAAPVAPTRETFEAVAERFGLTADEVQGIVETPVEELQRRDKYTPPSNTTEPTTDFEQFPVGAAKINYFGDPAEAYVEVLREFDPQAVDPTERDAAPAEDVARYADWASSGLEAPYANVTPGEAGRFNTSNRRRILAAREAGLLTVKAWFSPDNAETGNPLKYGDVMKAVADAADAAGQSDAPMTLATLPQQMLMVARESDGFVAATSLSGGERAALAEIGLTPDEEGQIGVYALQLEAERRFDAGEWDEKMSVYDNAHIGPLDARYSRQTYDQSGALRTETAAFRAWFGDSKAVGPDGEPLVVYHGTTGDFDAFDRSRANPESDLGAGFYFSNTTDDVGANYAGEGPDLTQKIERLAERIADETDREYNDPEVIAEAKASLGVQHGGATLPVYLSIQNPVVLGGENETRLDYEQAYDEDADEYGEPTGRLVEFADALREELEAEDSFGGDADRAVSDLLEYAEDGLTATEVISRLKASEGLMYASDENGDLTSNEIIRRAFAAIGFDGYIDHTVDEKFGSQRRTGQKMEGMNEGATHYVAFRPEQIKSVFNRGTFAANDPRILYQMVGESARGVPTGALTMAREMEYQKKSADEIFTATGWMRGDDGFWRFEISDQDASMKPGAYRALADAAQAGVYAKLGDILHHPAIYAAYPALKDIAVTGLDLGRGGGWVGMMPDGTPVMGIDGTTVERDPNYAARVVLHEVQHLIQDIEGFAVGATVNADVMRQSGYADVLKERVDALLASGYNGDRQQAEVQVAREIYNASAGEVEARNTEGRRKMTRAQRRQISPESTRDVPRDKTIVRLWRRSLGRVGPPVQMVANDQGVLFEQAGQDNVGTEFTGQASLNAPRPGEPTTGSPSREEIGAGRFTSTPAFWRWFGKSVVAEANGEPLTVYHGTPESWPSGPDAAVRMGSRPFFVTADKKYADSYARGGETVALFASVQNPANLDDPAVVASLMDAYRSDIDVDEPYDPATDQGEEWALLVSEAVVAELKARGHDGAVLTESKGGLTWAVFEPTQVKSAIANRGTFDPADPRILYQSEAAPPFYSALLRAVETSQTKRASADQWKATIAKTPGVKRDEIDLLAVNDWLDAQEGPVERDALAAFVANNGVQIDVIVQGGEPDPRRVEAETEARLERYADEQDFYENLDAGEYVSPVQETDEGWSFNEDLFDTEDEAEEARAKAVEAAEREMEADRRRSWMDDNRAGVEEEIEDELRSEAQFGSYSLEGDDDTYQEFLFTIGVPETAEAPLQKKMAAIGRYTTHWRQRGVIGHVRTKDRRGVEGEKVLEVQEVQSDILQAGRDKGFSQPASPEEVTAAYEARFEAQAKVDAAITAKAEVMEAGSKIVMPMLFSWDGAAWLTGDADSGRIDSDKASYAAAGSFFSTRRARAFETPAEYLKWELGVGSDTGGPALLKNLLIDVARRGPDNGYNTGVARMAEEARLRLSDAIENIRVAALQRDEAHQRFLNASGEGGVPDAPFKTSWAAMLMKRMIRHAIDNGYDKVVWITGEQQNGGSTVGTAGEVSVTRWSEDSYSVEPDNGSRTVWALKEKLIMLRRPAGLKAKDDKRSDEDKLGPMGFRFTAAEIKAIFNTWREPLGDKMIAAATTDGEPVDFDASAVGIEDDGHFFYDKALVNITNDILKRYGGKVERVRVLDDAGYIRDKDREIAERRRLAERYPEDRDIYERQISQIEENARGREQPGFTITPELREAATRGFTLFQGMTGPRGSIDVTGGRHLISLMAKADKSTFLHEAGHRYLFQLFEDAADPNASDELKADVQIILGWMNVASVNDVTREQHEKWAETFEQYLMEGKAPSVELRGAFQRFSAWLKAIYDGVRRTLPRAAINDDIRGVMDRLLATDEQIAEARTTSGVGQGIQSAELAGMTPEAFAEYAALADKARDKAHDDLLRQMMRAIRREKTAEWNEQAAEIRPDIAEDVDAMPDIAAVRQLRATPMSREIVVAMMGNEAGLALLPKGVPPLVTTNGVHPDVVAEAAGYPSGQAMLNGLMDYQAEREQRKAEGAKGSVREARIEERVREEMLALYGDPLTDGSIEEEALAALHSDQQGAVLAAELGILGRRAGQTPSPYTVLRQWAARHIGQRPITEARPQRFLKAERAAASAAIKALTAKDKAEAFRQKQAQTVNFLLYSEARKAKRDVEKAVARMQKLGRKKTIRSMDQDYLDRIHDILGRYDLTEVPQTEVRARASLLEFVAEKTAAGDAINIPSRLIEKAERKHYSTLTVDEVRELDETIRHLAGLGRLKQKILDGREERELAAVESEAVESASLLKDKPYSQAVSKDDQLLRRLSQWLPNAEASNVKIQATLRRLDNGARGVWTRVLDVPGQLAANKLSALRDSFWRGIIAAEKAIPASVRSRWSDRLSDHPIVNPRNGQPMTELIRQDLIGMARHVGSMSNFEKFAKGWGIISKEADEFEVARARFGFIAWLDSQMDPTEWAYVEAWWEAHDQQRDEYFDNERDLTGVRPIPVEPEPFDAAGRRFKGGYAPISYDSRFDERAAIRETEDAQDIFGGFTRAPSTSNGSAQDRTTYVGPVNFGMARAGVDAQTQMLRIAYGRYITDALKFLRRPAIREAVRLKQGDEAYNHILAWLGAQVKDGLPPNPSSGVIDKLLRGARANFTVSVLLMSATVIIAQPAGLAASAAAIRGKLAKGMARAGSIMARGGFMALPEFVFERSNYMRLRVEEGGIDRDIRNAVLAPTSTATAAMIVQPGMSVKQRAEAATAVATAAKDKMTFIGGVMVGWTDFFFVSAPTWLGVYDSALAEGQTEDEAVLAADAAVQRTQGGGRPIDQAGIQRGSEAAKMLTFAFGWANAHYNLQRDFALDIRDGRDRAGAMVGMTFLLIVAPLLDALLSNDWPDFEDEENPLEVMAAWFLRNVFFGIPAGIPVVREFANIAEREMQGKYTGSALTTPTGKIIDAGKVLVDDVMAAANSEDDKELSRRWPAHVIMALGMTFGLPGSVQLSRVASYGTDVADGEQNPEHIGDWINGLLRGPQNDQE